MVADEFLIRLNAKVGDTLRLGGRNFKIAAVLESRTGSHYGRRGDGTARHDLDASLTSTGLLAPGSRVSERLLVKLPDKTWAVSADAEAGTCADSWNGAA